MPTQNKINILLVEDELLIQKATSHVLKSEGYSVSSASTGEVAVKIIRENETSIDLILMDIDLGSGIDGTVASEQILTIRDIPIVFLSSHMEKEIVEKTEKITSYGYVMKGANRILLMNAIKMALKLFQAKTDLKKERNQLDELYNKSPAGYHSFDAEGKLVQINDTLLTWLGYSREDSIGKLNFASLINEKDSEFEERDFISKMKKGPLYNLELFYFRKNGSILPILFTSEPVFDNKGNFIKTISVAFDHTRSILSEYELQKTKHELEVHQIELEMQNKELKLRAEAGEIAFDKYSHLFEDSPLGYISINRAGCILDLNQSGARLMKNDKVTLIGQLFGSYLTDDTLYDYKVFLNKVYQGDQTLTCDIKLFDEKITSNINLRNAHSLSEDCCFMMMLDTSSLERYQAKFSELKFDRK